MPTTQYGERQVLAIDTQVLSLGGTTPGTETNNQNVLLASNESLPDLLSGEERREQDPLYSGVDSYHDQDTLPPVLPRRSLVNNGQNVGQDRQSLDDAFNGSIKNSPSHFGLNDGSANGSQMSIKKDDIKKLWTKYALQRKGFFIPIITTSTIASYFGILCLQDSAEFAPFIQNLLSADSTLLSGPYFITGASIVGSILAVSSLMVLYSVILKPCVIERREILDKKGKSNEAILNFAISENNKPNSQNNEKQINRIKFLYINNDLKEYFAHFCKMEGGCDKLEKTIEKHWRLRSLISERPWVAASLATTVSTFVIGCTHAAIYGISHATIGGNGMINTFSPAAIFLGLAVSSLMITAVFCVHYYSKTHCEDLLVLPDGSSATPDEINQKFTNRITKDVEAVPETIKEITFEFAGGKQRTYC